MIKGHTVLLCNHFCKHKRLIYQTSPNELSLVIYSFNFYVNKQITTILSKLTEVFLKILTLFCFKLIIFNKIKMLIITLSFLQKREYLAHKICKLLFIIHSIFIFSTYIFQFPVSILKNLIFPLHLLFMLCFLFSKHSFSENMKFNESYVPPLGERLGAGISYFLFSLMGTIANILVAYAMWRHKRCTFYS
uniref:Uncharacterized protein n=1 Tax=Heterorhabditis bacteriophora TaxID=37862 RepID=A0A1I7WPU2_HETBA